MSTRTTSETFRTTVGRTVVVAPRHDLSTKKKRPDMYDFAVTIRPPGSIVYGGAYSLPGGKIKESDLSALNLDPNLLSKDHLLLTEDRKNLARAAAHRRLHANFGIAPKTRNSLIYFSSDTQANENDLNLPWETFYFCWLLIQKVKLTVPISSWGSLWLRSETILGNEELRMLPGHQAVLRAILEKLRDA